MGNDTYLIHFLNTYYIGKVVKIGTVYDALTKKREATIITENNYYIRVKDITSMEVRNGRK
jgi:uncharacterized membrane protein YjfL (UPF0719 family)